MLWRTNRSHINRRYSDSDVRDGDRPASPYSFSLSPTKGDSLLIFAVQWTESILCTRSLAESLTGGKIKWGEPSLHSNLRTGVWPKCNTRATERMNQRKFLSSYKNQGNGTVIKYKTARGEFLIGFLHFSSEAASVSVLRNEESVTRPEWNQSTFISDNFNLHNAIPVCGWISSSSSSHHSLVSSGQEEQILNLNFPYTDTRVSEPKTCRKLLSARLVAFRNWKYLTRHLEIDIRLAETSTSW